MPSFSEWSLQALRHRAESAAGSERAHAAGGMEDLSVETLHKMVHELQVHQIELEMQNDQLRHTQQELDGARARYFDLYDLAPVGYCTVDEHGLILEANLTAALNDDRKAVRRGAETRNRALEQSFRRKGGQRRLF